MLEAIRSQSGSSGGGNKSKEQLQALEAAMLTWTRQIKQALRSPVLEALEVHLLPDHFFAKHE